MINISINRQSGYTLIELMIAGFLGLILLLGVMQIYLGASRTNRLQSGVIEVQDKGRFLIAFIEKDLQRAGWTNFDSPAVDTLNYIDFTNASSGTSMANSASGDVAGISNDWIRIEYQADDEIGVNTEYDCAGTAIPRGVTISNQYSIVADASGIVQVLECNGREIITGVDSFQILYGVESIAAGIENDGIVDAYIRANQITGYEGEVIAIRIAVLLHSTNDILDQLNNNTYQVLDERFPSAADKKLRRLFVKTISLPNHPVN